MRIDRRTWLARSAAAAALAAWGGEAFAQSQVQYQYDALGRVVGVTYPNGATISYAYDDAGNRTQLTQTAGTAAPTGTFSASPGTINAGASATLSWTSSGATSASIDNGVGGVTPVASGSVNVSPTVTTTYTLTLTGPGGQTTMQATVTVNASGFNQTIQITGSGPVNLRTLANNAGYNGAQNATITFVVGSGVTLLGTAGTSAVGGGRCIETGTWPSGSYTIALTLQISGKVYGGGGGGGVGGGYSTGSLGTAGGDALYAQENLTVVVNAGGELKAGGGGGGGGGAWYATVLDGEGQPETTYYNGSGGGGAFPNGQGGAAGNADVMVSVAGANGTTSGGGAGGAATKCAPSGPTSNRWNGAGGAGGAAAAAGASGGNATGTGGAGTWVANGPGSGGAPGYAVRKNGKTVTVTNNGTIAGAQG
ncbi:MAG: RHS repeat protein [Hyphomonadaceae bacterium]|nr:RHS repeat protein [Hyphomonadaceae bacterium]